MDKPEVESVSATTPSGGEPAPEWEVLYRVEWRKLLRLQSPVSIKARRWMNGRWEWREPTEEEVREFLSNDAW